jgi:hypothetical protein
MLFEFALLACGVAVMVGALSRSAAKAALFSSLMLALIAFAASLAPGGPIGSMETQPSLEAALIQALAVMPAAMILGLTGHGVRWGLGRLRPRKPSVP